MRLISNLFFQQRMSRWSPFLLLILVCTPAAQARVLNPGENETLSATSPIESWSFGTGSTLTVNGADTLDIRADGGTLVVNGGKIQEVQANDGAVLNFNNATVTGNSGSTALSLVNSTANVTASTISGLPIGLQVIRETSTQTGSTANLQDSTVQGVVGGAFVSSFSVLNLIKSTVEGTGATSFGLSLAGGSANLTAGSKIIGGLNGLIYGLDGASQQLSQLVLNNSSIEGRSGAAIVADLSNNPLGPLVISVLNGSTLIGGNGSILEVAGGATVELNVTDSQLNGNVIVESGSKAMVSLDDRASLTGDLQNISTLKLSNNSAFNGLLKGDAVDGSSVRLDSGSTFTGNVENVSNFTLNDSTWVLAGNNQVGQLAMAGGTLDFVQGETFYRLDVEHLSGNGVLKMATDFGGRQTDFLNITGTAEGSFQLAVTATGTKPTSDEPIQLVKVAGGNAEFALNTGSVDAGAFTYKLFEEGDGWYLRPDTQISTSTRSVLAIANTAPTIIDAERTLLNTRMGDRRLTGGNGGVWMRTYGNRYSVQNGYGDGYSQTQQGLVIGADTRFADSDWLVGAMVGYSKTDLDLKRGSSGTVDSYSVGGYLTKFDAQTGFYIDAVTKINSFDNKVNVSMSDGERSKGDYNTYGLSGSLEVGKQYDLNQHLFLTPFVQVNAAVVSGKHYSLDNGLDVDSQRTRSFVTKGGMYVGSQIDLGNGQKLQPRVRVAMGHEFIKSNEVHVNDSRFNNDTSTTSMELAGGVNWALPNGVQIFAEAGSSQSRTVSQDYNLSAGFSIAF
ncbi:autotransporter outer membrane beta-barrel domain-containing protein [Pseudomonas sp. NPDC087639]|uniref:autotransporter outer membrane beta-barrel domain-containing protein n=1 Tax=Pseudomonas sp. NPDC087639 TaxID=3364445 RepID=UPI0038092248